METYPSQPKNVVTIEGKGKLIKSFTLKVRMDTLDLQELDKIASKLKFGERATTIRYLIHHYGDIEIANNIVVKYGNVITAKREFNSLF